MRFGGSPVLPDRPSVSSPLPQRPAVPDTFIPVHRLRFTGESPAEAAVNLLAQAREADDRSSAIDRLGESLGRLLATDDPLVLVRHVALMTQALSEPPLAGPGSDILVTALDALLIDPQTYLQGETRLDDTLYELALAMSRPQTGEASEGALILFRFAFEMSLAQHRLEQAATALGRLYPRMAGRLQWPAAIQGHLMRRLAEVTEAQEPGASV